MAEYLRIHSLLNMSRANGPGQRAVIWVQGCPFSCPNCFNPGLIDPNGGKIITIKELVRWLLSLKNIEGISISGGEPSEQITGLIYFLSKIRKNAPWLSILVFSGRTIKEIQALCGGEDFLSLIDVLIDGRYDKNLATPGTWPSSSNQRIHFLTNRYSMKDFTNLPSTEVLITRDGDVIKTGLGIYE